MTEKRLLVLFFGFMIAKLSFHVVTLKIALHVIYATIKYKTDSDIKEVIILDIFPIFTFTHYYVPSPPLWEVVDNIMSFLWRVT